MVERKLKMPSIRNGQLDYNSSNISVPKFTPVENPLATFMRKYLLEQRALAKTDRDKKLAAETAQKKYAQLITDPRQVAAGSVSDAYTLSKANGGSDFNWELTPAEEKELKAATDANGFMKKDAKLSQTILDKFDAQSKSAFGLSPENAGSILNNDKFKETRLEQLMRAKNAAEEEAGGTLPLSVYSDINKQQAADIAAQAKEVSSAKTAMSDALEGEEKILLKMAENGGIPKDVAKSITSNLVKSRKVGNEFIEKNAVPKSAQTAILNTVNNLAKKNYSSEQIRAVLTKAYSPSDKVLGFGKDAGISEDSVAEATAAIGKPTFDYGESNKSVSAIYDRLTKARTGEYNKAQKALEVAKMTPQEKRAQYITGLRSEGEPTTVMGTSADGSKDGKTEIPVDERLKKNITVDKELEGVPNYMVAIEGGAANKSYADGKRKDANGKTIDGKAVSNGYNYTTKDPKELRKDFEAAGIQNQTILDAIAGKDITLSDKENAALAKYSYDKHGVQKAKKIVKGFDNLPPVVQQMATQMAYRGDLAPGKDNYQGDLVKLLETGDMNKVYEYVNTSDKIKESDRKILKTRLDKTLTTMPRVQETGDKVLEETTPVQGISGMGDIRYADRYKGWEAVTQEHLKTKDKFIEDVVGRHNAHKDRTSKELSNIVKKINNKKDLTIPEQRMISSMQKTKSGRAMLHNLGLSE